MANEDLTVALDEAFQRITFVAGHLRAQKPSGGDDKLTHEQHTLQSCDFCRLHELFRLAGRLDELAHRLQGLRELIAPVLNL